MGESANEILTGIIGGDLATKGSLRVGKTEFDVVLPSWHQTEDDNNSLVGFLLDP